MKTNLFIVVFSMSYLLVGLVKTKFSAYFVDKPGERSSHYKTTPRAGGLGFVAAFFLGGLLQQSLGEPESGKLFLINNSYFCLASALLLSIGTYDDWRSLGSLTKLIVHTVAAGLIVYSFQPTLNLPHLLVALAALILIVALVNIYNFMDGLDGIVAGCVFFQLIFIWHLSSSLDALLLAIALLGFLAWNWQPAKIFMGDGSSTFLGLVLACLIIQPNMSTHALQIIALTFPLTLDGLYTLCKRILRAENILKAHRSHIYQRLHQAGWTHGRVAACYCLATIIVGIIQVEFVTTGPFLGLVFTGMLLLMLEGQTTEQPLIHPTSKD